MLICILDNDTYISEESVAGINLWVDHATDHYGSDEVIGSRVHLKTNTVMHIKKKSPNEIYSILKNKVADQKNVDAAITILNNCLAFTIGRSSLNEHEIINIEKTIRLALSKIEVSNGPVKV